MIEAKTQLTIPIKQNTLTIYSDYKWDIKIKIKRQELFIIQYMANNVNYIQTNNIIFLLLKEEEIKILFNILDHWINRFCETDQHILFDIYDKMLQIII